MPKTVALIEETATQYGRHDLERLGIFIEMPYMNGKKYNFPKLNLLKGTNIYPGCLKTKCGLADCYFEKDFKRIFAGERPRNKVFQKNKTATTPFIPVGPTKLHATPGDYFGTFTKYEYFSRLTVKEKKGKKIPPTNYTFITSPGKKGGPGYIDIGLSKYPEHHSDRQKRKDKKVPLLDGPMITAHYPQPYFLPNPFKDPDGKISKTYQRPKESKVPLLGGPFVPFGYNKAGGYFEHFPEGKPDKYVSVADATKIKRTNELWLPPSQVPKTMRSFLTIDKKTKTGVNEKTYETYEPIFTKYLV